MKLPLLLVLTVLLNACSGQQSPSSIDPYITLRQAVLLKSQGDLGASEKMTQEAISLFLEQGYIFGQSEAFFFLGDLYKGQIKWEHAYNDDFLIKSLSQFQLSKEGFESIGEKIQASKSALEIATLLWAKGNALESCNAAKDSWELYKTGDGNHNDFAVLVSGHKTAEDFIKWNIDNFCINNTPIVTNNDKI